MNYEVKESQNFQELWHVETIDKEWGLLVTIFSGPKSKERATECQMEKWH